MNVPVAIPKGMIIRRVQLRMAGALGNPDQLIWLLDFSMPIVVGRLDRPVFLEAIGEVIPEDEVKR